MFKISKFCIYFTLVLIYLDIFEGLDILNFHDLCGKTIYNDAGELRFDAHELPSYLSGNECEVTVQPHSDMLKETTQVLFYFTELELTGSCADMSVTIFDGPLFNRTRVKGLPEYICAHVAFTGTSDQIFTTRSDQFTVTVSLGKYFTNYPAGNFSIKFIPFHTASRQTFRNIHANQAMAMEWGGKCNGAGVVNCTNGRCIDNKYYCSDDIKACGEDELACDILKTLKEVFETIADILKKYSWILPVLIGLCVLKCFYKKMRKRICSLKTSICSRLRELVSYCRGNRDQRNTSRRSSLSSASSNFIQLRNVPRTVVTPHPRENIRETHQETLDAFTTVRRPPVEPRTNATDEDIVRTHLSEDNAQSSEYPIYEPSVPPQSSEYPIYEPSAPPPSYDEAVAPSYEEVVTNKHKYKTK